MPKSPRAISARLLRHGQNTHTWARGGEPAGLPNIDKKRAKKQLRVAFMFFINGAKERAPAAAGELLKLLKKK
jgi:hypothetical protein